MLAQLFFTNLHFTIKVLVALAFFATGWLHFGSWQLEKEGKSLLVRSLGFFLLSVVAIGQAVSIDLELITFLLQITKLVGLLFILASLLKEPLLTLPKKEAAAISLLLISESLIPLSAVLYFIIALTYLRKSTEGYEKQSRPMFFAFLLLALSELITVSFFAQGSPVVFWSKLLAKFGSVWIASHALEFIGIIILGVWTWGYIRFRAQAQLFIIFITSSLVIFTITTFSFTFLLLRNLETDALSHLKTDVGVLRYALDRLQSEALAHAKVISENSVLKEAFAGGDTDKLYYTSLEFMLSQETSFLDIATASGKVVMRAEDKEKIGDSVSENIVVKSALIGKPRATVAVKANQIAPEIQIRAATPITDGATTSGALVTGFAIDSAFVDGVKQVTGLDVSVFAKDTRAATTFVAPDGKSRFIGTKESDQNILSTVLEKGEQFTGPAEVLNQPYYTAYSPLKTADGEVVGMLFVGKLQTELFAAADRSIQLTFLGSALLMILSTIPAYFVARYIKENTKA